MSVDLTGAADLHCHFGPDPHRPRSVDAFEAATDAMAAGHRAVVLKSHDFPTASLAWSVQKAVAPEDDDTMVFRTYSNTRCTSIRSCLIRVVCQRSNCPAALRLSFTARTTRQRTCNTPSSNRPIS